MCSKETITLVTGNIVKFFQCTFLDVRPLDDMDHLAMIKIQQYIEQARRQKEKILEAKASIESEDEITVTAIEDNTFVKMNNDISDIDFE